MSARKILDEAGEFVGARARGGHKVHVLRTARVSALGHRTPALCGFKPTRSPHSTMDRSGWSLLAGDVDQLATCQGCIASKRART